MKFDFMQRKLTYSFDTDKQHGVRLMLSDVDEGANADSINKVVGALQSLVNGTTASVVITNTSTLNTTHQG